MTVSSFPANHTHIMTNVFIMISEWRSVNSYMLEQKQTLTLSYINGSHPVILNRALKSADS